jgi:integrase
MTGCRIGEVAGIQRSELVSVTDDTNAHLLLPPERVKNARIDYVPLVGLGLETVREAMTLSTGDWLFPGRHGGGPMRPHATVTAMVRFAQTHGGTWLKIRPCAHDLRRTCRSGLSKLKVSEVDARVVLNHVAKDVDGRVYDTYERIPERRLALTL